MNTRRKVTIGLLLLLAIALGLFVPTLFVVWGIFPREVALVFFVAGLAIAGATAWLGQWNNILALVDKLFGTKRHGDENATQPSPKTPKYVNEGGREIAKTQTPSNVKQVSLDGISVGSNYGTINQKLEKSETNNVRVTERESTLVNISSLSREGGKYVSLKVTSKSGEIVLCKAIQIRLQRSTIESPYGWKPIDDNEDRVLSWHWGRADSHGFHKVGSPPEYINIAKIPEDENLITRKNIVFTYQTDIPHKAGRYRIWIDIVCKTGDTIRTEHWLGCIETDLDKRKLAIMECEDVNEWKK